LGLLPLFLLWLNLSWWLFLFGAQVAQAVGNLPRGRLGEEERARWLGPWQLLGALTAVAQGQRSEDTPQRMDRIARTLQLPVGTTQQLLDLLAERGLLAQVAGREPRQFVLARPAENIRVVELLAPEEVEGASTAAASQSPLVRALGRIHTRTRQAIGELTLDQVLSESGPAEGS
jgi:membrane protein